MVIWLKGGGFFQDYHPIDLEEETLFSRRRQWHRCAGGFVLYLVARVQQHVANR